MLGVVAVNTSNEDVRIRQNIHLACVIFGCIDAFPAKRPIRKTGHWRKRIEKFFERLFGFREGHMSRWLRREGVWIGGQDRINRIADKKLRRDPFSSSLHQKLEFLGWRQWKCKIHWLPESHLIKHRYQLARVPSGSCIS